MLHITSLLTYCLHIKVLYMIALVGDTGSGKSSLRTVFAEDTFSEHSLSTVGVDFSARTLRHRGVQARHNCTHSLPYSILSFALLLRATSPIRLRLFPFHLPHPSHPSPRIHFVQYCLTRLCCAALTLTPHGWRIASSIECRHALVRCVSKYGIRLASIN